MFKKVKEDAKRLVADDNFIKYFNCLIVPFVFLVNLVTFVSIVYTLIEYPEIYYRFWETLFALMLIILTINIFLEMIQIEVDKNKLKGDE